MPSFRAVMVGAGGFAGVWVRQFLPASADRLQVAALVELDPATLRTAGDLLGVPTERRFADLETALGAVGADLVILAIPPTARVAAVALAAARGLPVLCEKPVAASWAETLQIARLVHVADLQLAVMQNYRHTPRILTLKRAIDDGVIGRVASIACRFAADHAAQQAGWSFRHRVPDAILYESAEHHFDQVRNLAGADAEWIAGAQANPPHSTFALNASAAFLIRMANGVLCHYDLSYVARGHQHNWHHEAYRVEGEHGSLTVGADDIVRHTEHLGGGRLRTTELATVPVERPGHLAVIDGFLDWLDGGPAPATALADNLRTAALTFAAVEASRTNAVVQVPAMLSAAGIPA